MPSTSYDAPVNDRIDNRVREVRDASGWTQRELAGAAGISRQALSAIEAGKSVPSTDVSLRIARALGCRFDDLFSLPGDDRDSHLARTDGPLHGRVAMGLVDGRWVAHAVDSQTPVAADGVAEALDGGQSRVDAMRPRTAMENNVLVAGCAPAIGTLGARLAERPGVGRLRWLPRPSSNSLDLLRRGLVHIAGLHLLDEASGEYNTPWVRRAFADRSMRIVNLARWEQGLVVAPGNPRDIGRIAHLNRPGVRVVRRPEGSGAQQLLERHLREAGLDLHDLQVVTEAPDHASVARLVSLGLADTGPCIRSTALELGLDFVPLAEERFDLVVPVEYDDLPSVRALLGELDTSAFRRELDASGGYDTRHTGHAEVIT